MPFGSRRHAPLASIAFAAFAGLLGGCGSRAIDDAAPADTGAVAVHAGWSFHQVTDEGRAPGLGRLNAPVEQRPSVVALVVDWRRASDGAYNFTTIAPPNVARVDYVMDGGLIGGSSRTSAGDFSMRIALPDGPGRVLTIIGLDAQGIPVATARGLLDVGTGPGVSIRPTGAGQWEARLDQPAWDVVAIEVDVDGSTLTDLDSSVRHSARLAVRAGVGGGAGPRSFAIATFGANGSPLGMLRRAFAAE